MGWKIENFEILLNLLIIKFLFWIHLKRVSITLMSPAYYYVLIFSTFPSQHAAVVSCCAGVAPQFSVCNDNEHFRRKNLSSHKSDWFQILYAPLYWWAICCKRFWLLSDINFLFCGTLKFSVCVMIVKIFVVKISAPD